MYKKVFAIGCLFTIGCGTLRNVSPISAPNTGEVAPKAIYGGVKHDAIEVRSSIRDLRQFPNSQQGLLTNIGKATAHSIDTPISAVGDTITLPVTIPAAIDRAIEDYYFPDADADNPQTVDTIQVNTQN